MCAITVVMWFGSTAVCQVCAITLVMWFGRASSMCDNSGTVKDAASTDVRHVCAITVVM